MMSKMCSVYLLAACKGFNSDEPSFATVAGALRRSALTAFAALDVPPTTGTHVPIDRLEVDLGEIAFTDLERAFTERFIFVMRPYLEAISAPLDLEGSITALALKGSATTLGALPRAFPVHESEASLGSSFPDPGSFGSVTSSRQRQVERSGRTIVSCRDSIGKSEANSFSREEADASALCVFLETGVLPWPHSDRPTAAATLEASLALVLSEQPSAFAHWLCDHPASVQIATRLSAWFSAESSRTVADVVLAYRPNVSGEVRVALAQPEARAAGVSLSNEPSAPPHPLPQPTPSSSSSQAPAPLPASSGRVPTPASAPVEPRPHFAPTEAQVWADGVSVDNAGLIVLHPFLRPFFDALGLLHDGTFRDAAAHARAVCLLDWVARGEACASEHQLAFSKVLCGMPVESVAPPILHLSEVESAEVDGLLTHVRDTWPALKNTSSTGLRQSFLMRNGILRRTAEEWVLRIEEKPWDLLLDRLPWGISHVRLSWMHSLLRLDR